MKHNQKKRKKCSECKRSLGTIYWPSPASVYGYRARVCADCYFILFPLYHRQ
jgi:hypothetical protein